MDTALTLPLFWRRSTVSPVFFGRFPRSSLHFFVSFPRLSPSLISHLFSVDVKQSIRFQALYLLRNDVHLEDFMHLIILASQATVTVRGLGLYSCISCYVCDVCRLLLMLLSLSLSAEFHCRWKNQRWLGSGKIVCKSISTTWVSAV